MTVYILLGYGILITIICVILIFVFIAQGKLIANNFSKSNALSAEILEKENTISNLHSSVEGLNERLILIESLNKEKIELLKKELETYWQDQIEKARKESVNLSRTIIRGRALEQFVAFSEDSLSQFSPSDFRMLGSPIDVIIFDGASEITDGQEKEVTIYFCDVKTGKAKLTKVQRAIKKAIENKKIEWKTLEIK